MKVLHSSRTENQTMFRFPELLLLCSVIISLFCNLASADPPYKLCSNTSIYSENSTFAKNLNTLLNSLPSNASVSKLYNTSFGNEPDKVFALYMCLDYLDPNRCRGCIDKAQEDITKPNIITDTCPIHNSKEAVVWEEDCQLRYSNQNFFGRLNVNDNIPLANRENNADPAKFKTVVKKKLSKLARQAAFHSLNMSATGQVRFQDEMVYALVQCTTDLSKKDCNMCLDGAIEDVLRAFYFSIGARLLSRSCYLRYEFYSLYEGAAPEVSVADNKGGDAGRKTWVITIITVAACMGVVAVVSYVCLAMRKLKKKGIREILGQHNMFHKQNDPRAQEYPNISLASIHAATDNFSDSNKLGEGGFGPVYKLGVLRDGKEVAIKRLSSCSEQGSEEFKNEVLLIMKLQHKNLVRLLGFCAEKEEKLLVYEYMPNSSLDVILFDPVKRAQLDWRRRVSIISGIARGILYLHEDSRLRIIHRDLKASNVLLDNEMNPKISDFGMARIFAGNEGQANTATIVGTYGYMAPEYAMEGLYSVKSDVYSFGVLVLEIITGRRNTGFHLIKLSHSLISYAWKLWDEGKGLELIDPLLVGSCDPEEFLRYLHIGLLCVQEDPNDRPTMSSAVVMLKSETVSFSRPEKPAFNMGRFSNQHNEGDADSFSINGLTVSDIMPR